MAVCRCGSPVTIYDGTCRNCYNEDMRNTSKLTKTMNIFRKPTLPKVTFFEATTLKHDVNPNGSEQFTVDPYHVSDIVAEWYVRAAAGSTCHQLRPAFTKAGRCWRHDWSWEAGHGYSAEGGGQELWLFEKGVNQLVELGYFSFPMEGNDNDG